MTGKLNRIMPESEGNLLCLQVDQPVTLEGYKTLYVPFWEKITDQYGEIRILYFYPDPANWAGWAEDAAAEDIRRFSTRGREVKKVAVVNAPEKVVHRWEILRPLLGGDVKSFREEEFEKALAWIKS